MVDRGDKLNGANIPTQKPNGKNLPKQKPNGTDTTNVVITRASPPKKVLKRNKSFPTRNPESTASHEGRLPIASHYIRSSCRGSQSTDMMKTFKTSGKSQNNVLGGLSDITKARDVKAVTDLLSSFPQPCYKKSSRYHLSTVSIDKSGTPTRVSSRNRALPSCPDYPSPLFYPESTLKISTDELRLETAVPNKDDSTEDAIDEPLCELANGHASELTSSDKPAVESLSNQEISPLQPVDDLESDIDFEPGSTPLATLTESSELSISYLSTSSNCLDSSEADTRLKKSRFLIKRGSVDDGSDENKSGRKWKKAALGVKTSLKFRDAGKMVQFKRMYDKMKNDSLNYM